MRRVAAAATALLVYGACTYGAPQLTPEVSRSPAAVFPSPSPPPRPPLVFPLEQAIEHARVLSVDIGRRPAGSEGEEKAAQYIESVLRSSGYEVTRHEARRANGGISYNVVARFPGVDYTQGYVIVGAHYDTVARSPGGNDNGSGSGVLLALAQALSTRTAPVEFIGFAAEEFDSKRGESHVGSRAHAAALADPALVKAMVSIDMVGAGPSLLVGNFRAYPEDLRNEIAEVVRSMGEPVESFSAGNVSDHTPYARWDIPAAWLWAGNHPSLHSERDTFEVVQPEAVGRSGRVALEWLKRRFGLQ